MSDSYLVIYFVLSCFCYFYLVSYCVSLVSYFIIPCSSFYLCPIILIVNVVIVLTKLLPHITNTILSLRNMSNILTYFNLNSDKLSHILYLITLYIHALSVTNYLKPFILCLFVSLQQVSHSLFVCILIHCEKYNNYCLISVLYFPKLFNIFTSMLFVNIIFLKIVICFLPFKSLVRYLDNAISNDKIFSNYILKPHYD